MGLSTMADCELCGAMKVSVRHVQMGKAEVTACARCYEKMNLGPKETAPGLARAQSMNARPAHLTPLSVDLIILTVSAIRLPS
ncbi:MAG: hypothetical protein OSA21_06985, partial [Candidatus Poseidoniaceae archaeon]|nr:hypothetical protein [Candidatus Poseidoniaceae archaeon]